MRRLLLYILSALTIAVMAAALFVLRPRPLTDYGAFPDFTLTASTGAAMSAADLKGEPWVAAFIFTRCAGQCPMMVGRLHELGLAVKRGKFVLFSVDPSYDTPEVMAKYAESVAADSERWKFLTGSEEMLNKVMTGVHMNKIGDPMMHSLSFVLVDRAGHVRGYYDSADPERLKALRTDLKSLL